MIITDKSLSMTFTNKIITVTCVYSDLFVMFLHSNITLNIYIHFHEPKQYIKCLV